MKKTVLLTLFFCFCVMVIHAQSDFCQNATLISVTADCTDIQGSFSGATISSPSPACAPNVTRDIWYKFVATSNTVSVGPTPGFLVIGTDWEVYDGCSGAIMQSCDDDLNNNYIIGNTYYIRVFNKLNSANYRFCVKNLPEPDNNLCTNASEIIPVATGTLLPYHMNGATLSAAPSCAPNSRQDVWHKFVATQSTMSVYLTGIRFGIEIFDGSCTGNSMVCVTDPTSIFYINNNFVIGRTYYVRVFNIDVLADYYQINIREYTLPVNDLCSNAVELTPTQEYGVSSLAAGSMAGSTISQPPPNCSQNAAQDVWYKFVANSPKMIIDIKSYDVGADFAMEIFDGGCSGSSMVCSNLFPQVANEYSLPEEYMNNIFVVGHTYYVRVFETHGGMSAYNFNIWVNYSPIRPNDFCQNATELFPSVPVTTTIGGSTADSSSSGCTTNIRQDVWYQFTATTPTIRIGLSSNFNYPAGLEIFEGSCTGANFYCTTFNRDIVYTNNNFVVGQTYYVRVYTNTILSIQYTIGITPIQIPANNSCLMATEITPSANCTQIPVSFLGAVANNPIPGCAPNINQELWYKFVAATPALGFSLAATTYMDPGLEIYEGSCSGANLVCLNSNPIHAGENLVYNNFNVGTTYYLKLYNSATIVNYYPRSFYFCAYDAALSTNYETVIKPKLYPNPTLQNITIEGLNVPQNYSYEIYDNLGRIMNKGRLNANGDIDLRTLGSGIYLLKLDNAEQKIAPIKFIKE